MSYLAKKEVGKILILGLQASGKTTIIQTVTEGHIPKKEEKYLPTIDHERKKVVIAGTELIIFDLGGQTIFLDRFTSELSDFIFSGVEVLIFVIDSFEIKDISRAKVYLDLSLNKLVQYSPTASAYLFQHKTDLIPDNLREEVRETIFDHLVVDTPVQLKYYETSVYNRSIFHAMGRVFAEASDAIKTVKPLLETFGRHNIVEMAQIFTKEGIPIIQIENISKFDHISLIEVRKVLNDVLQSIANSVDQISTSILFESLDRVFIIKYTEIGLVLILGFRKDLLKERNESVTSLYNKVLAFCTQLESIIPS
ncbi:MAG: ADP-ribosylation factor-like protein [Candidatus Hodarchaeales archaeon]